MSGQGPTAAWPLMNRRRTACRIAVLTGLVLVVFGGVAHDVLANPNPSSRSTAAATSTPTPIPAPSSSSPTAAPSPTPSAPTNPGNTDTGAGTESGSCGMLDLGCRAREAVTGWFRDLVKTAADPTFKLLGSTVLATPEMNSIEMSRARELWDTSQTIANTCFVLLISLAGVTLMAGTSLPRETGIKDLLPRVVFGFLLANLSLTLIGYAITFANGLARAFLEAGNHKIDPGQAADVLARGVELAVNTGGAFMVLLALLTVVLAAGVAFIYVVRLAATMVLIAGAPIALMFHALPFTEGLALLWWRAITGLLAIQVCQSLVFATALELLFAPDAPGGGTGNFHGIPTTKHDAIDLLMMMCLLWILIRIPSWVSRTIWRQGRPRVSQHLVRAVIAYKTLGMGQVFNRSHRGSSRSGQTGNGRRGDGRGSRGSGRGGGNGGRGPHDAGGGRRGPSSGGSGSSGGPRPMPNSSAKADTGDGGHRHRRHHDQRRRREQHRDRYRRQDQHRHQSPQHGNGRRNP
jgi:hypothetical protein